MNTKLILVIILVSLTACQTPSALAKEPVSAIEPITTADLALVLNSLPATLTIPPVLPTTIQDPVLLEGWIRLYNQQDSVQLWDGRTVTGRDLAQFILDQSIPVVWDTKLVCGIASCSVRYCQKDTCDFDDGKPGVRPIYINLVIQSMADGKMSRLVGTMAHEIFHRTAPYGKARDTLYEEFSAYYVGTQVSQSTRLNFNGYDGQNPTCLQRWFNDNELMDEYAQLKLYPQSVIVPLNDKSQNNTCPLEGDFTCKTDQYGLLKCK